MAGNHLNENLTEQDPRHYSLYEMVLCAHGFLKHVRRGRAVNDCSARKLLADNVRAYRREANLTQAALAQRAGIRRSQIGSIEQYRANPTCANVERIADALEVPPMLLFAPPIESFDYYRSQGPWGSRRPVIQTHYSVLRSGDKAFFRMTDEGLRMHLLNR